MTRLFSKLLNVDCGDRKTACGTSIIALVTLAVVLSATDVCGQSGSVPSVRTEYPEFLTRSLRHGMDTTVSPCTDFDRYVNGRWRDSTKLEKNRDPMTVFTVLSRETPNVLQRILDSARRQAPNTKDPDVRTVGYYYTSCLIADSLDRSLVGGRKIGAKEDTVRAALCRTLVMKDLSTALGQLYVQHLMTDRVDTEAMALMQAVRTAVGERVRALPWITSADKAIASASLEKMLFKIAKPQTLVDHRTLKLDTMNFAQNTRLLQEFRLSQELQEIGADQAPMWGSVQYNPNASFRSVGNSIEVPSFMFQWPFFDPEDDRTIGYGAVGVIIGHEMYHGVTSYLTSLDKDLYKARTKRLVDQYSAMKPIEGVPINGDITLSENVADLGGLLAAYQAWEKHVKPTVKAVIDGFTPQQRFFLAYARMWRGKGSTGYYGQLERDPHAVPSARINGVVMNAPAFAKAFGCKEGDPMAKPASERADIW